MNNIFKPTAARFVSLAIAAMALVTPQVASAAVNASSSNNDTPASLLFKSGIVASPTPVRTLSLPDCFARADAFNKEIITGRWNLTIAQAGIKIAGAIPNPQFQLQEGFGQSFVSIKTGQSEMIQWTQEIMTAGKRAKKLALARANYTLALQQFEALRFDVHNRVRRAYAELAAAEAYEALIEAERSVGLRLLSIAEKRFKAGKAPQTEVLQAQLNVSQFDTQRNQAKIRLQQDSVALALIIGETPEKIEVIDVTDNGLFKLSAEKTEIVPSPAAALPSLQNLWQQACVSRKDLKAAEQQVYANRKAIVLARAQRVPDLFVGSGYQWAQWTKRQAPEISPAPNSIGNGAYFTLTSEAPIFYQHQGEIQQAAAAVRQSEKQLELVRCNIAKEVATAYNAVLVARANIFLFQKNVLPTAAEVARVAHRGYQVGKTDLATAIVGQQQYQQTLSSYFDSVVAYQNAWAELEKAVGTPLRL